MFPLTNLNVPCPENRKQRRFCTYHPNSRYSSMQCLPDAQATRASSYGKVSVRALFCMSRIISHAFHYSCSCWQPWKCSQSKRRVQKSNGMKAFTAAESPFDFAISLLIVVLCCKCVHSHPHPTHTLHNSLEPPGPGHHHHRLHLHWGLRQRDGAARYSSAAPSPCHHAH